MSIGRDEFLRLLEDDFGHVAIDGDTITCPGAHVDATVRLTPLGSREKSGVTASRHLVEIVLDASCEAEAEVFLERFDRVFLRQTTLGS